MFKSYWIVEWKFVTGGGAGGRNNWKPLDRLPFESKSLADAYPKRSGFDYRIVEYIPAESDGQDWLLAPNEQAWWWHWDGEDYSIPFIYSVMVSHTGPDRYFIATPDSRWCDEVGGWWRKVDRPNVPSREWQASMRKRDSTVA